MQLIVMLKRKELFKIHGELNVAEGFARNNSQFGAGGLAQRFDSNFDYNYANGF